MRVSRSISAWSVWFVLLGLLPVFSSDTPVANEPVAPGNVAAEDDPLNPYVEGMKPPQMQPLPEKPRAPVKRKPVKKPKKNPAEKPPPEAPTAG